MKNVLEDRFAFLRSLHEFYGDDRSYALLAPFRKVSAFHQFIAFMIDSVLTDDPHNVKLDVRQDQVERYKNIPAALDPHPAKLPLNLAFERFGIDHESFEEWLASEGKTFIDAMDDDVSEYLDYLRQEGPYEDLLKRATGEVFYVLFQNRHVLMLFNDMISGQLQDSAGDEDPDYAELFARPGCLKRVAIPAWVQRAIFFRDRGVCVLCRRDLSGVLNISSEENYDHIVPLAAGGLNDVSNVQLLCRDCNAKKRAGAAETSNRYEAWYHGRRLNPNWPRTVRVRRVFAFKGRGDGLRCPLFCTSYSEFEWI